MEIISARSERVWSTAQAYFVLKNLLVGVKDVCITCKPDLSRQERQVEAILLKERWKLIQSGIDRKDIKIRNGSLYAKGKLHCRVENDKLITVNETISLLPTTVDTSSTSKNTPSPTLQSHVDISSNNAPMQSVTPAADNKSPS